MLWAARRRDRVVVRGSSMAPSFQDGDHVLVDPRAYHHRPPRVGDVVLARHPYRRDVRLVKRVAGLEPNGRVILRGDDPTQSTDSRTFGALPPDRLLGRVVLKLA